MNKDTGFAVEGFVVAAMVRVMVGAAHWTCCLLRQTEQGSDNSSPRPFHLSVITSSPTAYLWQRSDNNDEDGVDDEAKGSAAWWGSRKEKEEKRRRNRGREIETGTTAAAAAAAGKRFVYVVVRCTHRPCLPSLFSSLSPRFQVLCLLLCSHWQQPHWEPSGCSMSMAGKRRGTQESNGKVTARFPHTAHTHAPALTVRECRPCVSECVCFPARHDCCSPLTTTAATTTRTRTQSAANRIS